MDSLDKDELGEATPEWLKETVNKGLLKVTYTGDSEQELREIINQGKLEFYDNFEDMSQVIQEVFELNPHSVHTLNKHKEGIYAVALDNLNIVYSMN